MTIRPLIFNSLFLVVFVNVYGQKLSSADSLKLLNTWQKTANYLKLEDTKNIRSFCLDSIDCKLCGFRDDTITDTHKSVSSFFKDGLPYLLQNKKLWKMISSDTPDIVVSGYLDRNGKGERIYSVAYLYWKPNEIAENHEGGQVLFDFVLRKNIFKLRGISTVP